MEWTARDQEVWRLYYMEGLSDEEIGALNAQTRAWAKRCRKRHQQRLDQETNEHATYIRELATQALIQVARRAREDGDNSVQPQVTTTTGRAEVAQRLGVTVELPDLVETKTRTARDPAYTVQERLTWLAVVDINGARRQPDERTGQDGSGVLSSTADLLKGLAKELTASEEERLAEEAAELERKRAEGAELQLAFSSEAESA